MFFQQLSRSGYDVENIWEVATLEWFQTHADSFEFAGGDIERLLKAAKMSCAHHTLGLPSFLKLSLSTKDIEYGISQLKQSRTEFRKISDSMVDEHPSRKAPPEGMYI